MVNSKNGDHIKSVNHPIEEKKAIGKIEELKSIQSTKASSFQEVTCMIYWKEEKILVVGRFYSL